MNILDLILCLNLTTQKKTCLVPLVLFSNNLTIQHHLKLVPVHVHSWLDQRPITSKTPALHSPGLLQIIHPTGDAAGVYEWNVSYILYIYIHLEPKWPIFWKIQLIQIEGQPPKKGVSWVLGIYIYKYLYWSYVMGCSNNGNNIL